MKKFIVALIVLLIFAATAAGVILYMQSQPLQNEPSASQSQNPLVTSPQKGPSSPTKVQGALESAIRKNQDTVAWLTVPNTDINNSVVQANDNDFYLRKNEMKEEEIYGCYFADYECSVGAREVLEPNTIIYGHSSPGDDPDGQRFSQLFRLENVETAKNTPYIYLVTPDESLTFEIFAVFYTLTDFDYIRVQISNDEMREITLKAEELSIYDYEAEINPEDKILTLSTCSENLSPNGDGRFVVMARLLPEGEKEKETADFTVK